MPQLPAIVVAAGLSRRMGTPKPLLPWTDGRPLILSVVQSLLSGGASPVTVVLGHEAERVRTVLTAEFAADSGVNSLLNPRYNTGEMLSSVQAAASRLPDDCGAFMVALGDQPGIRPRTLGQLIDAWTHAASTVRIVAPEYAGKRGHPLVISADLVPELLALDPDRHTLRDLVQRHVDQRLTVAVDDPAVTRDLDDPDQYRRALQAWPGPASD
jgi:molybdenum cofactor cytidylyltransferase